MNPYNTAEGQLLSDLNDFLTGLETVLQTASIDERVAIENAAAVVYNERGEEDIYQAITATVAELRDRIYDYLEN